MLSPTASVRARPSITIKARSPNLPLRATRGAAGDGLTGDCEPTPVAGGSCASAGGATSIELAPKAAATVTLKTSGRARRPTWVR